MRISRITGRNTALACVLVLLAAAPAGAADVYLAGSLGISSASGDASGTNSLEVSSGSWTGVAAAGVVASGVSATFSRLGARRGGNKGLPDRVVRI